MMTCARCRVRLSNDTVNMLDQCVGCGATPFVALEDDANALTINDTNRDGTLQIMDTQWDSNGTLRVTVRDNLGCGGRVGGEDVRAMRRLARRALPYPEKTRSARVIRRSVAYDCPYVTFAVSRLDNA